MKNNILKNFCSLNHSYTKFLILCTLFYGVSVVSLSFYHFEINSLYDIFKLVIQWLLVTFLCGFIIHVLNLNRWLFAILYPLLTFATGIVSYYVFQYNLVINSGVIESTFYTNNTEINSQISFRLVIYVIILLSISLLLVIKRFKNIKCFSNYRKLITFVLLYGIIFIVSVMFFKNTIQYRIPFNIYYGFKDFFLNKTVIVEQRTPINHKSSCEIDTLNMVVVIGEALRADHVSINGYHRNTFPKLASESVISFSNIYSEWTHTLKSLPHILTRADSTDYSPAIYEQSFISIFKYCGFSTWWIGNQDLNPVFENLINEVDTIIISPPGYDKTGKIFRYDEALLPYIKKALQSSNPKKLIVVHQIGCHWWYPYFYPSEFEIFKPVLNKKSFKASDREKIINAYDNAAYYTDYFLSEIIKLLKNTRSIMIYLSDHGELLGEHNKYIHAQDTPYEKNPACFIWLSDAYISKFSNKATSVKINKTKRYRTDFLFHSVLDAAEIRSPFFKQDLSIFYGQTDK